MTTKRHDTVQTGRRGKPSIQTKVRAMGKKSKRRGRRKVPKPRITEDGRIIVMDSLEATRAKMPKYDGFAIRGGVHGDTSYNRRKEKHDLRRQLDEEL